MRRSAVILALWALASPGFADALPTVSLAYTIDARYIAATRTIEGRELVVWTNPASEALDALPVHLYQNAFSHGATTWMLGSTAIRDFDVADVLDRDADPWGYTRVARAVACQDVEQARAWARGESDEVPSGAALGLDYIQPDDGNALDRSLAELRLPRPLPAGAELCLAITFVTRLSTPIARSGAVPGYVHAAQWFPKLGVLEPPGRRGIERFHWGARQFHGPTEFYADFADYDVTLELPPGWSVVATGERRPSPSPAHGEAARVRFAQRAVHDFSWVAGRALYSETHRHAPAGGGDPIDITYVVPRGQGNVVGRMRRAAETTFDVLGARVGVYPYSTMKVIAPPWRAVATSGMEYPTLVTGMVGLPLWTWRPLSRLRLVESTVAHEVTHNYFYGLLANDEQREAFLDEGFTSYWEAVITARLAHGDPRWYSLFGHPVDSLDITRQRLGMHARQIDEAVVKTPSNLFFPGTHAQQIYVRPELILLTAARRFGDTALDDVFRVYFERFRFRHPTADDFFAVVSEVGGAELGAFLWESFHARELPNYAVDLVESEPWTAPLGHVPTDDGEALVTRDEREDFTERRVGLAAPAQEPIGAVIAEITDPGYAGSQDARAGSVARRELSARGEPSADPGVPMQRSYVRLRGPGLRHLPVDVEFHFADGVIARDRWDGRATWRAYRFVRPARLTRVAIDPEHELLVDVDPSDNGWVAEPEPSLAPRWASWLGAVGTWIAASVALWL